MINGSQKAVPASCGALAHPLKFGRMVHAPFTAETVPWWMNGKGGEGDEISPLRNGGQGRSEATDDRDGAGPGW